MKVLKDLPHPLCKITLFWWNQKYILKFEKYNLEQTFKINEFDVIDQQTVEQLTTDNLFMEKILKRFEEMYIQITESLDI